MIRTIPSGSRVAAFLCLLMALCTGAAFGNDLTFRPVNGGLQMTLSTNGYQFHVGEGVLSTTTKAKRKTASWLPSGSLVASVALVNRGSVAVPFTFADESAAERRFRFRVFNEEGEQIWESEAPGEGAEGEGVVQTLVKRSPWRRTVQVPLNVGGGWLPSGRYTLEASVDAQGGPGGTAVFEVVNQTVPGIPPAPDTGIKGRVVTSSIWTVTSTSTILPPTKDIPVRAYVTVQEIVPSNAQTFRAPYSWSGFTDEQGNFTAPTIAGRFKVTASLSNLVYPTTAASRVMPPIDEWPNRPATIEVDVPLGQYVDALLRIGRGPVIVFRSNVYSVDEVTVASLPTTTPEQRALRITADGTVNSGGWSNGQLVQRRSLPWLPVENERLLPIPIDVLEFDFVATPPKGPATTVMSPITATKDIVIPEGIRQIRVYSKTNSQSVDLPLEL